MRRQALARAKQAARERLPKGEAAEVCRDLDSGRYSWALDAIEELLEPKSSYPVATPPVPDAGP